MNIHLSNSGQGQPLVLFHGWGFDSRVWDPVLALLEDSYQLICVDLPGFGYTPCMEWEEFKSQLLLMLPQKFSIAGWSLGGLFATRLAIEAGDRITALLNIGSSPCFVSRENWPGVDKAVFSAFHDKLAKDAHATLREFVRLQAQSKSLLCMPASMPSELGLSKGLTILDTWDLREGLYDLTMPVAYFFGRLDPITPKATMQVMQDTYRQFRYVLFQKSAHMPFISHAEEFVQHVKDFFQ